MKYKAHLALLFCNIVWAMDYPFYKIVLPHYLTPSGLASASLVVAALFSLIPLLWQRAERVSRRDALRFVGAALLIGVMRKVFLMEGLSRTSPIDGSIIDTVVPVLVLGLSVLLGIDRFTPRKVAGIVLGMAGAVAVVVLGGTKSHTGSMLWGNILIFLCALSTSLYMVWFKKLLQRYKVSTALRWVYCIAAVMMLPFGIREAAHLHLSGIDARGLFALLFVLTMPTYLPNFLLNYSLKFVQPTVSSIYTYIQPVVATMLSIAFGLDHLRWDTALAALVIFAGVGLVLSSYRRGRSAAAASPQASVHPLHPVH